MWLPEVITSTPDLYSDSAVDVVRPIPPATFSPLAVTKSTRCTSRSPGSSRSTASRPGRPMTSPIMRIRQGRATRESATLLRVLDGTGLADDGHLDLARVGQRLLDLLDDVAGEPGRRQVVDLLGPDEDPDFAAGLDGERPVDAGEAARDRLQVLEPLEVELHGLAARARARGADRVGDLHDGRLQAGVLHLLVMRGDPVHDLEREVVTCRDGRADRGVRTLDLVVDRLAHVVEEAAGLRGEHVRPELRGDDRRQAAGLDDVVQHVLAVAGAELEATEEARDLGRQAGHAGVVGGRVAGLADDQVHLGASLRHDLLDPAGMDPPVGHQLRERDPGDLAPDGIEA